MENVIETLVTDRALSDVRARNEKGLYQASDLNRVETAVMYIADLLRANGFSVQTNGGPVWEEVSVPTWEEMTRYLSNLQAIRAAIPLFASTPDVPADMDALNYREANNIEKILQDAARAIQNKRNAVVYSGQVQSGMVPFHSSI